MHVHLLQLGPIFDGETGIALVVAPSPAVAERLYKAHVAQKTSRIPPVIGSQIVALPLHGAKAGVIVMHYSDD